MYGAFYVHFPTSNTISNQEPIMKCTFQTMEKFPIQGTSWVDALFIVSDTRKWSMLCINQPQILISFSPCLAWEMQHAVFSRDSHWKPSPAAPNPEG